MMLPRTRSLFFVPVTCGAFLGSAPKTLPAQTTGLQALATAELGNVRTIGPFAGIGAETAALFSRFEARLSFNRLGALEGGCMGSCELRDVSLWELGLGVPLGTLAGTRADWAVGIGVGTAAERYDRRRWSWSPYAARTWQPAGVLAVRVEGRIRAFKNRNSDTLLGGTVKVAVGIGLG